MPHETSGPAPRRPADPAEIDGYTLLGLLGNGGMGKVYLGRAPGGRLVAVKVVRPDLAADPSFTRRFHREAMLARRVAQFCTAEVIDVGEDDGRPFLVTEYIDGPTLWDAVQLGGPMPRAQLERIAISVATALTAIHGADMVHRDLKPSNVMLSSGGPLVIDFGIAHAMDGTTQITSASVGTPAFMAPEQARGEHVTPAADIFAWGGVVVYAATGQPPFGVGRPESLLYRVVHERPALDGVPGPLRSVVAAAMRPAPRDRPTAQQLYARLLAGATDPTPPPTETVTHSIPTAYRSPPRLPPEAPLPASIPPHADVRPHAAVRPPAAKPLPSPVPVPISEPAPVPAAEPHRHDSDTVRRRTATAPDADPPDDRRDLPTRATGALRARLRARLRSPKVLAPIVLAAVLAVTAPLFFVLGGDNAAAAHRSNSEIAISLVTEARRISADEPELARRLAVAAHAIAPGRDTRFALAATAGTPLAALVTDDSSTGGQQTWLNKLAFGANGTLLAAASSTGVVYLGDVAPLTLSARETGDSGIPVHARLDDRPEAVGDIFDVAIGHDGTLLATAGADGSAALWDLSVSTQAPRLVLAGHGGDIHDLTFNGDSSRLATASDDGTARLWDVSTGQIIATVSPTSTSTDSPVRDIGFSPDGGLLVATSGDGSVGVWTSNGVLLALLEGHAGPVNDLAFNRDGTLLATAGADGTARLWDIGPDAISRDVTKPPTRRSALAVLTGHTDDVVELAFGSVASSGGGASGGSEGTVLATASSDGTARIWDVDSDVLTGNHDGTDPIMMNQPRAVLEGHEEGLVDLAFGPDGTLATASIDGTARLWDVATGTHLATLGNSSGDLRDLTFDPDGTVLATAGAHGTAELWDLDPDRLFARACATAENQITPAEWDRYVPELRYDPPCGFESVGN